MVAWSVRSASESAVACRVNAAALAANSLACAGSAFASAARTTAAYLMAYVGSVHRCGFGLPSFFGKEKS